VVSGSGEPKGQAGGGDRPARQPTAQGSNVRAIATAATAAALKPAVSELQHQATAFKRDYEERARELADDVAAEDGAVAFSETAHKEASEAKALAAERRQKAIMQGYTGNMCSECQNFTMVRNGTCEKCDTCGSTSGCS
jgi:ribonucleoside-diphosphate reductase alpha chain